MENLLKLIKNPLWIYLVWLLLIFFCGIVVAPLLSKGSSGGEQKLFIYTATVIEIGVYGLFLISLLTSLNVNWFKKYWYINIPVFLITGYLIVAVWFKI